MLLKSINFISLGLLSSMYYAQRAKDCAMEERLKIALEERDAALLELEDMIHVMTKLVIFILIKLFFLSRQNECKKYSLQN